MENSIEKKKIKGILTIENLLCLYLILCPILDMLSFIFRNQFQTTFSISTFLRPIIPIIAIIYIFFKDKIKIKMILVSLVYLIYAILHLYVFYNIKTDCAYGGMLKEFQYIVNYSFMIMNLFIYIYFFAFRNRKIEIKDEEKGKAINKLKLSILISATIYITFMFIAIITGTSSATYIEENIGYKGWFESGNSIGATFILSLFIICPMLNNKNNYKIRILALVDIILIGTYLIMLLGTRTGLIGFIIVIISYIICKVLYNLINVKKVNTKILLGGLATFTIIAILIGIFGSITFERRKNLNQQANTVIDVMTGEKAHITGDLTEIVKSIKDRTMDESYMSIAMQESILDLYNYANKYNLDITNRRMIQFIYHNALVKNQNSIPTLVVGNGYMSHFYELILEMEVPAFLFNFGIFGFFLYFIPFFIITIYGCFFCIKKIKQISVSFAMAIIGMVVAIMLSLLTGYTFFNSSTMMIIIVLASITINDIRDTEDNEIKIYER